jgi:hypothetical protein
MRVVLILAISSALIGPASAGPEMPSYQFPQANQIPMLPSSMAGDNTPVMHPICTPAQTAPSNQVAAAETTAAQPKYHVVDGKCVPDSGN